MKTLAVSAALDIGFTFATIWSQSGIDDIGRRALLANRSGRFRRLTTAISVSYFAILIEMAVNMLAKPKASKNITRPKDFEGKKFATSGLPQIEPTLRTLMKCDNADFSKVEMVNVGQKLSPALLTDQVDVVPMLPAWEGVELELKGNQLKYVKQNGGLSRGIFVLKARGVRHATEVRAMSLGTDGITVGPRFEGARGVLTGLPVGSFGKDP